MGGVATAALARQCGMSVILLESHTKPGGCAGWFSREGYTFDVGATALLGLAQGEPLGDLLGLLDARFQGRRTSYYRALLPDREIAIHADRDRFEREIVAAFPELPAASLLKFWRLQERVGTSLLRSGARIPRFPPRSLVDVAHNLRILGLSGLQAAAYGVSTVDFMLRRLGLDRNVALRTLIAMLLQDTAQAGPDVVPFANACACLQAYRSGMSRPEGGMKALFSALLDRFQAAGGAFEPATIVERVERRQDLGFTVHTRRRDFEVRAETVAFSLPPELAAGIAGIELKGRLARAETRSRAVWSAVMAYAAIDRNAISDDAPLFHQAALDYDRPLHDGNNVLISLSPPGDLGYGPAEVRIATLSTHTNPSDWLNLDRSGRESRKQTVGARLIAALERALPGASQSIRHREFASPASFARYTRRSEGRVGGPPVLRSNSNLFALDSAILGRGLWLVGDSVFPGQGTLATLISAIRVVQRITGKSWEEIKSTKKRGSLDFRETESSDRSTLAAVQSEASEP